MMLHVMVYLTRGQAECEIYICEIMNQGTSSLTKGEESQSKAKGITFSAIFAPLMY